MTIEHTPSIDSELLDIDIEAHKRLAQEVTEVRREGYDVLVASSQDRAYQHPDKVRGIFTKLRGYDDQLAQHRKTLRPSNVGAAVVGRLMPARRRRSIYQQLEPMRRELLFDPTSAMPWHDQRGRAPALLTITSAYELDSGEGDGVYATMSGPLDESVLEYRFDERAPRLRGSSVREALVWSDMEYRNKKRSRAEASATRRMQKIEEFIKAPATPAFKEVVQYCTDSIGIRERQSIVHSTLIDHITHMDTTKPISMMSFGCGTALPMLEVMSDLKNHGVDTTKLILLDQDPLALAAAATLARQMGLEDAIEIHCERLFSKFGKPLDLKQVLGGRMLDVAEDSGLREYLPDGVYRDLATNIWGSLKDGGIMTTGNMNIHRPQAEFLEGMMGWQPSVRKRLIKDNFRLHEEAGIPRGATKAVLTRSGVYSMLISKKPTYTLAA